MKKEWICKWQMLPGCVKQTATFATEAEARRAMAKVLTDVVGPQDYIQSLRREEGEDCNSSADFLEQFFSDLSLPQSEAEIPDHDDIPDHCRLEIYSCDEFTWGYMHKECPLLTVGYPNDGDKHEPLVIAFNFENPKAISRERATALEIRIYEHVDYGSSAYPLMIWQALGENPQTQEQIIRRVYDKWDTVIERKTVGRHLQLLQDMGIPVCRGPEGYYMGEEPGEPKPDMRYSPSTYPLLILQVLDGKTKAEIAQAVQEKFGVKIDRKAITRHLEMLSALGLL